MDFVTEAERRKTVRIAALLASHNRKEKTLACLRALRGQIYTDSVRCDPYLVDAGSSDGTVTAVRGEFPDVDIVCATDRVYWCGAMRIAWARAMPKNYDHLLLLNDDTVIIPTAVQTLLTSEEHARQKTGAPAIVVGSTIDPVTNAHSYGGVRRGRNRGDVIPSEVIEPCDQMSCNCTLVPADLALTVGELDPSFSHALADHDYSLRAKACGFSVWVAPGYLGSCARNPTASWTDPAVPIRERWKALHSPKGLPPREWALFCRRHLPYQWPVRLMLLYLHVLLPSVWQAKVSPDTRNAA